MKRALMFACLLLTLGCSSYDPQHLDRGEELEALSEWAEQRPRVAALKERGHRVLVALPVLADETRTQLGDEDTYGVAMRPELRALGQELTEALARVFGADGQVALAASHDDVARQAWEQGYDLIVRPRLQRWDAIFLGTNGWWYPNAIFLAWYFWPIGPHWWIADEVYGVNCELVVDVEGVSAERALPGLASLRLAFRSSLEEEAIEELEVISSPRLALDDLDRGLDLFGTWTPGDLGDERWEQTGALLEPYARRCGAIRLVAAVADGVAEFDALPSAERAQSLAAVHALVVGIGAYQPPCEAADGDARRVLESLVDRSQGLPWVPDKNATSLVNAQASREAIVNALSALARRAAPEDELVLYFAGRGQRREGAGLSSLALETYGGTLLGLDELAQAVREVGARRVLIVLDADFAPGPRGGGEAGPAPDQLEEALAEAFLTGAEGGAVVLASSLGPEEQAQTYDGQGLLTRYLLQGLSGEADQGQDGLTYDDLRRYLTRQIVHLSQVALPHAQRPLLVARGAEQVLRERR